MPTKGADSKWPRRTSLWRAWTGPPTVTTLTAIRASLRFRAGAHTAPGSQQWPGSDGARLTTAKIHRKGDLQVPPGLSIDQPFLREWRHRLRRSSSVGAVVTRVRRSSVRREGASA